MIHVEANANDLKQLVKIGKEFPGLNVLEKLDNIRITEGKTNPEGSLSCCGDEMFSVSGIGSRILKSMRFVFGLTATFLNLFISLIC